MPSLRPAPAQTLSALFTLACVTGTGGALQGAPRGLASRHAWRPDRRPGRQLSRAGGRAGGSGFLGSTEQWGGSRVGGGRAWRGWAWLTDSHIGWRGGQRKEARLAGEHAGAPPEVLDTSPRKPLSWALTIRALSGRAGWSTGTGEGRKPAGRCALPGAGFAVPGIPRSPFQGRLPLRNLP